MKNVMVGFSLGSYDNDLLIKLSSFGMEIMILSQLVHLFFPIG